MHQPTFDCIEQIVLRRFVRRYPAIFFDLALSFSAHGSLNRLLRHVSTGKSTSAATPFEGFSLQELHRVRSSSLRFCPGAGPRQRLNAGYGLKSQSGSGL